MGEGWGRGGKKTVRRDIVEECFHCNICLNVVMNIKYHLVLALKPAILIRIA